MGAKTTLQHRLSPLRGHVIEHTVVDDYLSSLDSEESASLLDP